MSRDVFELDHIERRPVDIPTQVAKLLKAAGVEQASPEVALGLLFGGIAHLLAATWSAWPEGYPFLRDAAVQAADEIRQVALSANPNVLVEAIMENQRAIRRRAALRAPGAGTQDE